MPQNKKGYPIKRNDRNALIFGVIAIVLVFLFSLVRFFGVFEKDSGIAKNDTTGIDDGVSMQYKTISFENVRERIRSGDKVTLLDIRSFEDFMAEHAVGAINIPTDQISSSDKIAGNNVFVIIGKSEDDTEVSTAVSALRDNNFDPLVLAGGMYNWKYNGGETVSFGNPTSILDQSKVNYLEIEKAKSIIDTNSSAFILDVRDKSAFDAGHIKNATNIPLLEIEQRRSELSRYPLILVFGLNEIQAFQGAVQVYDLTLNKPFVVKGSIPKWQSLGYEIVK